VTTATQTRFPAASPAVRESSRVSVGGSAMRAN
jgi:hypothetical protein